MKKVLFATTAIVLTAGAAAAQNVTFSGTARVGLNYAEDRGFVDTNQNGRYDPPAGGAPGEPLLNDTFVEQRLRFNIDASKETDAGVTFGGRTRIQYDENMSASVLNAAYVYAEFQGLRVEVGNSNTAMDTVALLYNSEIGFIGQTFGSYRGQNYLAYVTGPYNAAQTNRVGIFAAYSIAGFNVKASYVTPNQLVDLPTTDEFSMAADYTFGAFTVAGAFALDSGFQADQNDYFLGAEYAVNPDANVGLHINHTTDNGGVPGADFTTVTLYGSYTFGAITGRGYIAHNSDFNASSDYALGLGADYDLGGATLAGHIARDFDEDLQASLGVKFSF